MIRFLSQGYKVNRLSKTFKKFYGKHTNLVGRYKKNVCQMFPDSTSSGGCQKIQNLEAKKSALS